ncbi:MAG TPA: hypothetical protein VFE50_02910 [Cyclobacteriaceae bacterium]|nr:hypothetical protein [Cyclobacteriaceae bacterium]
MKTLFEETQRFTQWWLWAIIGFVAAMIVVTFSIGLYTQFILNEPWGDKPLSDEMLLIVALFNISAMIGVLVLFYKSTLEIVVDKDGVSYRFPPLLIRNWRRIERENIESYDARRYYLRGYGIRWDLLGNKTVNVKGTMGIEFKLYKGRKLLLGTQHPNDFLAALDKMKNRSEN